MKKFFWCISIMCIAIGLVTGCRFNDNTGNPVTRNVAEIDQQKGSETKQNKKEQDGYETASVPVKKEEYTGKLQHPELVEHALKPVTGESKKQNANRIIKATILEHIDGDTFQVTLANDKVEVVRFLCIDTPEVHHPRLGLQPFGLEGAAFTAKYAPVGKEVELEMDVGERDKFKRLVAYVWIDGQLLNRMLVERGLARVAYIYLPNTKYVDYLEKTQKKAQKEKRGILLNLIWKYFFHSYHK